MSHPWSAVRDRCQRPERPPGFSRPRRFDAKGAPNALGLNGPLADTLRPAIPGWHHGRLALRSWGWHAEGLVHTENTRREIINFCFFKLLWAKRLTEIIFAAKKGFTSQQFLIENEGSIWGSYGSTLCLFLSCAFWCFLVFWWNIYFLVGEKGTYPKRKYFQSLATNGCVCSRTNKCQWSWLMFWVLGREAEPKKHVWPWMKIFLRFFCGENLRLQNMNKGNIAHCLSVTAVVRKHSSLFMRALRTLPLQRNKKFCSFSFKEWRVMMWQE